MRQISTEFAEILKRKAFRREVATIFQVPEHLLGQETGMNHAFANGTSARLTFVTPDGTTQEFEFKHLQQLDYTFEPQYVGVDRGYAEYSGHNGLATFKIVGVVNHVAATPAKKDKPAKAPKKPTLQASARAARKATTKHAQLTKRIFNAERALIALKNHKAATDTELKTAREAVLAAI